MQVLSTPLFWFALVIVLAAFGYIYYEMLKQRRWTAGRKERLRLLKEEALEKLRAEKNAASKDAD